MEQPTKGNNRGIPCPKCGRLTIQHRALACQWCGQPFNPPSRDELNRQAYLDIRRIIERRPPQDRVTVLNQLLEELHKEVVTDGGDA